MAAVDPYRVLGVRPDAEQDDITAAYRSLSQQVHPDRTIALPDDERRRATERMVALNWAYEQIGDAETRRAYDRQSSRMPGSGTPVRYGPGAPTARGWWSRWWRKGAAVVGIVVVLGQTGYRLLIPGRSDRTTIPRAAAVTVLPTPASGPESPVAITVAAPTTPAPTTATPTTLSAGTGCWFVQLASTGDADGGGTAWARLAVELESPQLPMFFVSFVEWPDALAAGTRLAGTVTGTEQASLQVLQRLGELGVTDAPVLPMPIEVCRRLVPFL